MGFSLKSVTKAVSKPFAQVGKAIHWTDWGQLAVSTVALGAVGAMSYMQRQQQKAADQQYALQQQAAQQSLQAQLNAATQVQTAPQQVVQNAELAAQNNASDARRRFSFSRTTQGGSVLGSSIGRTAMRNTLG